MKHMEHNSKHDDGEVSGSQLGPVYFEFTHPTAASVSIAGTFDDWQPEAKPMRRAGQGRWLEEIALPPGTYEYCLVVDGKLLPDPRAEETVPNPFGGKNSLLKVANPPQASWRADARAA